MRRLMIMCSFLLLCGGCNLLSSVPKDDSVPPAPKPEPTIVFTEQDYWNQLAKNVNADVFDNTDDLCSAIDKLVKTGELKDVTRIADIRKTRIQPISGDAKTKVIETLKGSK